MKIEKTITYTLEIDENNLAHLNYEGDIENDIACTIIARHVIERNIEALQAQKKSLEGEAKKATSLYLDKVKKASICMDRIIENICANYRSFKLYQEMKEKKEALKIVEENEEN